MWSFNKAAFGESSSDSLHTWPMKRVFTFGDPDGTPHEILELWTEGVLWGVQSLQDLS